MDKQTVQFGLPLDLATEVRATASHDEIEVDVLLRRAIRSYKLSGIDRLLAEAREEARLAAPEASTYTAEDVERLVHELRAKKRDVQAA